MSSVLYALLYVALLYAALDTAFRKRPTVLYAAALLLPVTQELPSPVPFFGAPANIIFLGLIIARLSGSALRTDRGTGLPIRLPLILFVSALLSGVVIRIVKESLGQWFAVPFDEMLKTTWNWFTPLLIYALSFRLVGTAEVAEKVIRICQLSIVGEAAIAVFERIRGTGRATAHLGEPNRAGAYFAGASAFFLAFCLTEKRPKMRGLFFAAWLVSVAALFASLSRGGMLSALLANGFVLVVFFLATRQRGVLKAVVVVLLVVVLLNVGLLLPERVQERILFTFGGDVPTENDDVELDGSAASRLEYWTVAWQLVEAQPLGYGMASFPQTLRAVHGGPAKQAHNVFLQYFVECGIQGFVAAVLLVCAVFFRLFRRHMSQGVDRANAVFLALSAWWIAHSIAHIFTNSFLTTHVIGQFWLMSGCALAVPLGSAPRSRPSTDRSQPGNEGSRKPGVVYGRRPTFARPRNYIGRNTTCMSPADSGRASVAATP